MDIGKELEVVIVVPKEIPDEAPAAPEPKREREVAPAPEKEKEAV